MCFFFKQKTAYELRISDWSSDVCSAELRCVEVGMIGADDPRFFEGADAAQAGRGGQSNHLRQLDIGDPAEFLEFAENLQVDLIEFLARHLVTSVFQACGDHNIISADCNCPTMRRDG